MPDTQTEVPPDVLAALRGLTDDELVGRVMRLAARERRATALLVAHLAELATRDLHLRAGHSSLFAYCRDALGLAEHDAYNRIEAARAARRFPVVLDRLAAGSVNVTTLRLVAPHLTADNHLGVLDAARGKRRAQVEELVATLAPYPEAPTFVRKLPAARREFWAPAVPPPRPAAAPPPEPESPERPPADLVSTAPESLRPVTVASTPPVPAVASWRRQAASGEVTPLAPDRYKLQVTIAGSTLEKLRLAKDMLRHALPSGDEAAVLDRALTVLLADLARAKFAASDNPRAGRPPAPGSRHIPADVKRTVWLRDFGRCAFTSPEGRRCDERAFVEFHHVSPYANEGEATVANIQLRCRRHNAYESRTFFVHRQT